MVGILNLSQGSTIALHAALHLSKGNGDPVTTHEAAEALKVSEAHLAKIFQRLNKAGIVRAVRGPKGGYLLDKPLSEIRLLDVFQAIEGTMKFNSCLMTKPSCGTGGCMLGTMLEDINKQVLARFEKKLSEL
jgi:Rrf2 family protein